MLPFARFSPINLNTYVLVPAHVFHMPVPLPFLLCCVSRFDSRSALKACVRSAPDQALGTVPNLKKSRTV